MGKSTVASIFCTLLRILYSSWMYDCLICKTGCPETLVLDMSKLVWSVLTVVKPKDPLSSEVITL